MRFWIGACLLLIPLSVAAQPPSEFEQLLERDSLIHSGIIEYTATLPYVHGKIKAKVAFKEDGEMKQTIATPSVPDGHHHKQIFVVGKEMDSRLTFDNIGSQVVLEPHTDAGPTLRYSAITGRGSLGLGLGCSYLRNLKLVRDHYEGNGARGILAYIYLGEGRHGIPLKVVLQPPQGDLLVWTYGPITDVGGGIWLPKTAHLDLEQFHEDVTLVSAKLNVQPTQADLTTTWFAPGFKIIDSRVKPSVPWTYDQIVGATGSKSISAAALLQLSEEAAPRVKAQLKEQRRRIVKENSVEPNSPLKSLLYTALGVGAFALAVSLLFRWLGRDRPAPARDYPY